MQLKFGNQFIQHNFINIFINTKKSKWISNPFIMNHSNPSTNKPNKDNNEKLPLSHSHKMTTALNTQAFFSYLQKKKFVKKKVHILL